MATFACRTKDNVAVTEKKPRVYFTCHPDDFARYFDKICEDIFKTHDCEVFYTTDMTEPIAAEQIDDKLGRMALFVVPVTFRLLSTPSRAMDCDIAFAKERHIPILPFMMESGIDAIYARPEKFGERQYLSPFGQDTTQIEFQDKLKQYLEAVLISDEMATRIRAAFDAYIFLSYRKKDRCHANELMRLIHNRPAYRDIAIWYDEFLTLGESFRDNIAKALEKSQLFALVVTPNLLEDPNFVMNEEYPFANGRIPIFPAEMVETDRDALQAKYQNIPPCANPKDQAAFEAQLLDALVHLARRENDDDPEHNFLIGIAYLEGIDVERNPARGLELITSAAEAGLLEAMKKLFLMYTEGAGIPLDYHQAVFWAEKAFVHCKEHYDEKSPETLTSLSDLARAYSQLGQDQKAVELQEKCYALHCEVVGEKHPDTLTALNNLALTLGKLGQHQKALVFKESCYALRCEVLGEKHPDTLTALNNLAFTLGNLGQHQKALELQEKCYALCCEVLGEKHPDTLTALCNLAFTLGELWQHQRALELQEKCYALHCEVLGEKHPATLTALNNLARALGKLGQHQRALELREKCYALRCEVLGEKHPATLTALGNLASALGKLGQHQKALEFKESCYALHCEVLGEKHPATLTALSNLAVTLDKLGQHQRALELQEKCYALCCEVVGKKHPDTLTALGNLARALGKLGQHQRALELREKCYALRCEVLGEKHPVTLTALGNLAVTLSNLGQQQRALELQEKCYALRCEVLGEKHPGTILALNNLAYYYAELGKYQRALELQEKCYALRCEVLGEDHPDTLRSQKRLSEFKEKIQ